MNYLNNEPHSSLTSSGCPKFPGWDDGLIDPETFDQSLRNLENEIDDPNAGCFGPDSQAWRWNRELANFLAAGRAALMQLAHPPVAQAIWDHSQAATDPRGRFQRTFENVFAMSYGDLPSAIQSARGVHSVHQQAVGVFDENIGNFQKNQPYQANRAASLFWVHATLVDSVWKVRKLFFPGSELDWEAYYQQSRIFVRFFGLDPKDFPRDTEEFSYYMSAFQESGEIAVGSRARELGRTLLSSQSFALAPIAMWYRWLTGSLLPGKLATEFGLPARPLSRWHRQSLGMFFRVLPPSVRFVPGYWEGMNRIGPQPSLVTRYVSRTMGAVLGMPKLKNFDRSGRDPNRCPFTGK